jgi:hypothetical protein
MRFALRAAPHVPKHVSSRDFTAVAVAGRRPSSIPSKSRTEIDAEPHTRSNSALAAALFSASAKASGEAASGEIGTSRMT